MSSRDCLPPFCRGLKFTAFVAIGCLTGLVVQNVDGEVHTDPVAVFPYSPLAQSDTRFSLPVHRMPDFEGTVASIVSNVITVSGAPNWTDNQFVYAAGSQTNTYYALIGGGALEGAFFPVLSNTANSLSVDTTLQSLDGVTSGEIIWLVPYWTFGTLFPSGEGISGNNSHAVRNTEILVYSGAETGINISPSFTYYYFNGTAPGWRRVGGGLSTNRDNDIIVPNSSLIYRQNTAVGNTFVVGGSVQMAACGTLLTTKVANTKQDNPIGFTVALPMTLNQSHLFGSGIFGGAASHTARADELLVFDNAQVGKNKSPTATYYYFTGTSPGWRRVGGGLATVRNDDIVFQPGQSYIIRKAATASSSSQFLQTIPGYLQ